MQRLQKQVQSRNDAKYLSSNDEGKAAVGVRVVEGQSLF